MVDDSSYVIIYVGYMNNTQQCESDLSSQRNIATAGFARVELNSCKTVIFSSFLLGEDGMHGSGRFF